MKMKVIFIPYCSFAMSGLSELRGRCQYVVSCASMGGRRGAYMKLNIFRRMVKGRGTMSNMNSAISATSRRKTCMRVSNCKPGLELCEQ